MNINDKQIDKNQRMSTQNINLIYDETSTTNANNRLVVLLQGGGLGLGLGSGPYCRLKTLLAVGPQLQLLFLTKIGSKIG